MEYTNNTLDSLATQYQWVTGVKNVVLWFDSIALGLIGNLVVLTLLFILWRSYLETRQDMHLPLLSSDVPSPTDDILDNAEQKQRFQNFIWQVMGKACACMQQVANQVNGTLVRREEKILRYSVDAYLFFMKPLRDAQLNLLDFLRARESLTNNDFILAQHLFIELYNIYEYRRPWLRDMASETFPDFPALNLYKDWEKADRDMGNELEKILRDCDILAEKIVDLTLPTTRRWEKGGS